MRTDTRGAIRPDYIRAAARPRRDASDDILPLTLDEAVENQLAPTLALRRRAHLLCSAFARSTTGLERLVLRCEDTTRSSRERDEDSSEEKTRQEDASHDDEPRTAPARDRSS